MRTIAVVAFVVVVALLEVACLRSTEFHCESSAQCDPNGTCQPTGYCSVPDTSCASGARYTDTAGGQADQCVGGGAEVDAGPVDGAPDPRCPAGYVALPGMAHRYLRIAGSRPWNEQRSACAGAANTYLAIPDDAAELAAITTYASTRVWVGITDEMMEGTFLTVQQLPAVFLPWEAGAPGGDSRDDCVEGIPTTTINDERCDRDRAAVCECTP